MGYLFITWSLQPGAEFRWFTASGAQPSLFKAAEEAADADRRAHARQQKMLCRANAPGCMDAGSALFKTADAHRVAE